MQQQLERYWNRLQAISQEHMTRLRVSAVFHRSVEEYQQQLLELKQALRLMLMQQQTHLRHQQRSSSSGVSSEAESQLQQTTLREYNAVDIDTHNVPQCGKLHDDSSERVREVTAAAANTATDSNEEMLYETEQKFLNEQRVLLRKYLMEREQLLVEVGRMVRLGRLLKTRLKEPFILDAATGKRYVLHKNYFFVNFSFEFYFLWRKKDFSFL